jgi:predicted nucleic acid-binding protein
VLVVDASVMAVALVDDGRDGDAARRRLRNEDLAAPEILDLEVMSVLRRYVDRGTVRARAASAAVADLLRAPIARSSHRPLGDRCWQLRANLTPYDAAYVALAELLEAPLVTGDARLAAAPGVRCEVEVLSP